MRVLLFRMIMCWAAWANGTGLSIVLYLDGWRGGWWLGLVLLTCVLFVASHDRTVDYLKARDDA